MWANTGTCTCGGAVGGGRVPGAPGMWANTDTCTCGGGVGGGRVPGAPDVRADIGTCTCACGGGVGGHYYYYYYCGGGGGWLAACLLGLGFSPSQSVHTQLPSARLHKMVFYLFLKCIGDHNEFSKLINKLFKTQHHELLVFSWTFLNDNIKKKNLSSRPTLRLHAQLPSAPAAPRGLVPPSTPLITGGLHVINNIH